MYFKKMIMRLCLLILIAGCASQGVDVPSPAVVIGDSKGAPQHEHNHGEADPSLEDAGYIIPELPVHKLTNSDKVPPLPVYKIKKDEKVVAVQVLLFNYPTLKEVEARIGELKKAGVNTLILRVFQNRGDRFYPFADPKNDAGVYFKSSHAPVVDDILGEIAQICRLKGMKIYAWMTTRYADYGVEKRQGWQAVKYDLERERFVRAKGLNLFRKDVKNYLISIYKDLAVYDIDGILFQDDLILRHTEGFSHDARLAFAGEFGHMPDPRSFYKGLFRGDDGRRMVSEYGGEFWTWSRWKNRALLGTAADIMKEVKGIKPDMKFAINLMYEAAIQPENALAWLSQDLEEAVRTGFDLYAVMAYHRQISREMNVDTLALEALMRKLVDKTIQKVKDPAKALIKLQITDWQSQEVVPHEEINNMLKIVNKKGAPGLAFVPYRDSFDFSKVTPFLAKTDDYRLATLSKK